MTETTDNPTPQDGNEKPTTHDSATASEPVATEPQDVVSGGSTDDTTAPQTTSEEGTPEGDELDTGVYVAQI